MDGPLPSVARRGPVGAALRCPLIGVVGDQTEAFDPRRTLTAAFWHPVCVSDVIYTDASKFGRRLDMLRREFIAGAATVAFSARPSRAQAQQSATRRTRIGVLIYSTPERDPNTQTLLE